MKNNYWQSKLTNLDIHNWPKKGKETIDVQTWAILIKNFDLSYSKPTIRQEFKWFMAGCLLLPFQPNLKPSGSIRTFNISDYYEREFLAAKLYNQVKADKLLGPFPDSITYFAHVKKIGVNSKCFGTLIQRSSFFVVLIDNIDKWREV